MENNKGKVDFNEIFGRLEDKGNEIKGVIEFEADKLSKKAKRKIIDYAEKLKEEEAAENWWLNDIDNDERQREFKVYVSYSGREDLHQVSDLRTSDILKIYKTHMINE